MKLVLILCCIWGVCLGEWEMAKPPTPEELFEQKWTTYSKVDPTDPGGDSTINAKELSTSLWKWKPGKGRCYRLGPFGFGTNQVGPGMPWSPLFLRDRSDPISEVLEVIQSSTLNGFEEEEEVKKCLKDFKNFVMSVKKAQACIDKSDKNGDKVLDKDEFRGFDEWLNKKTPQGMPYNLYNIIKSKHIDSVCP